MEIAVLGIDLGKNSCGVVGLDGTGKVILRRRLQRESVIKVRLRPGTLPDGDGGVPRRGTISAASRATRGIRFG